MLRASTLLLLLLGLAFLIAGPECRTTAWKPAPATGDGN